MLDAAAKRLVDATDVAQTSHLDPNPPSAGQLEGLPGACAATNLSGYLATVSGDPTYQAMRARADALGAGPNPVALVRCQNAGDGSFVFYAALLAGGSGYPLILRSRSNFPQGYTTMLYRR